MHLDDNPDYMTIWKLAHDWVNADLKGSDENTISFEIKNYIHRLLEASYRRDISVRTHQRRIFIDESYISLVIDLTHTIKFMFYLRGNKINKIYFDSLYVKRNEVLNWCINIAYLDFPPCWAPKQLTHGQTANKDSKNYRPSDENEDRIRCQAIASALWELDPAIHPQHIVTSKIMQRFGNGKQYNEDTLKSWIAEVDSLKKQRKRGPPPKIEYKIQLELVPQAKD